MDDENKVIENKCKMLKNKHTSCSKCYFTLYNDFSQ